MIPEVIKTKMGRWDIEMGVNMDGELVLYVEHDTNSKPFVHVLGAGPFTDDIDEEGVYSGALFYIDE
jgi:hypothetical protein